jgi:hypothetical protein
VLGGARADSVIDALEWARRGKPPGRPGPLSRAEERFWDSDLDDDDYEDDDDDEEEIKPAGPPPELDEAELAARRVIPAWARAVMEQLERSGQAGRQDWEELTDWERDQKNAGLGDPWDWPGAPVWRKPAVKKASPATSKKAGSGRSSKRASPGGDGADRPRKRSKVDDDAEYVPGGK